MAWFSKPPFLILGIPFVSYFKKHPNMKHLLILLCLVFGTQLQAQDEYSKDWITDFNQAKKISAKKDMPILMYFTGSDWCKPCKQLKVDYFDTEEFKDVNKKMVLLLVDRPYRLDIISEEQMTKNKAIIKKYNKQKSFPLMLLLDKNGKVKDEISGYSGDPRYYRAFVNKHS